MKIIKGILIHSWCEILAIISTLIVHTYGGCEFKNEWSGKWFISGAQNVLTINSTWIETKGQCVENHNDKYLVEDRSENCFRCMVIHEKHPNVLQYKETYCDRRDTLDNLCNQIAGDATLYSMFRVNPYGGSVSCPFKGPPFTFTYNRGSGECASPVSRVDSCTDDSRMLFRYQACPDIDGTESTVEELVCLATWKDGSTRYLVGKLSHMGVNTDEDSYRCFVYERTQSYDDNVKYNIAQSGDATCNGLVSPLEGSKTMRLTKVENSHTRCKYPAWITNHHHWHTLDYKKSYHFSHRNSTLRISEDTQKGQRSQSAVNGGLNERRKVNAEMRVVCHAEVKLDQNVAIFSAHITSGCESGYICMEFYRRDAHVIELHQSTTFARLPEEACSPSNFNPSTLTYVTLITATLPQRKCPHLGRFTITGQSVDGRQPTRQRREFQSIGKLNTSEIFDNTYSKSTGKLTNANELSRTRRDGSNLKEREDVKEECNAEEFSSLNVGCSGSSDSMEFHSSCSLELNSAYSCHGSWEENGTYYLIASPLSRKSTEAHRYCFISTPIYEQNHGNVNSKETAVEPVVKKTISSLMLSTVADTCYRNIRPGITGIRTFNLSLVGQCAESRSADTGSNITVPSLLILATVLAFLYSTR